MLASISYMLYGALKDIIGDESEETVTIIIPDALAGDMKTYLHKVYKCQSLQMFPNINALIGFNSKLFEWKVMKDEVQFTMSSLRNVQRKTHLKI